MQKSLTYPGEIKEESVSTSDQAGSEVTLTGGEIMDYYDLGGGTHSGSSRGNEIKLVLTQDHKTFTGSQHFKRIIRTEISKKIISDLEWLIENHAPGESLGATKIQSINKNISTSLKSKNTYDPFDSFLMSLRHGLNSEMTWVDISNEEYQILKEIIIEINNDRNLTFEKVDKFAPVLDDMGIYFT